MFLKYEYLCEWLNGPFIYTFMVDDMIMIEMMMMMMMIQ